MSNYWSYCGTPTSPTYDEIASDWVLWQEYVDPNATMSEREFDALDHEERVNSIVACFGKEK